jgi:hypothetical protein
MLLVAAKIASFNMWIYGICRRALYMEVLSVNFSIHLFKAKKKYGFPVSRPYLAFGRRNPDPKLFYWIILVSVSTWRKKFVEN